MSDIYESLGRYCINFFIPRRNVNTLAICVLKINASVGVLLKDYREIDDRKLFF